jgi:hypothetical protein
MEARIVVAMTLRKFDFTAMYEGIPFQQRALTAKPVAGMPMRVKMAQ